MTRLRWTTAGESHGLALIGVLEGVPAGLARDAGHLDRELERRQGGYGRGGRMKIERDRVDVLSGIKGGVTLGSPIALRVPNRDATIEKLPTPTNPRPGHADLAGCQKFGTHDPRAVLERASARETAMRVALAGVARQVLEAFGIEVFAHVVSLGTVAAATDAFERAGDAAARAALRGASDFMSLDPAADGQMRTLVDGARSSGDSLGGVFEVRAMGVVPGLGSYASGPERMTARIGAALLSIPAMKGIEFGLGFESARRFGSEVHDPILPRTPDVVAGGERAAWGRFRRESNRAGGLEGGLTNGEPLVVRVAMKPIPTLRQGIDTVDFGSGEAVRATYQRSDVTSVPAASVVGEAMLALTLAEAFLEKFGGDSMDQVSVAYRAYLEQLAAL